MKLPVWCFDRNQTANDTSKRWLLQRRHGKIERTLMQKKSMFSASGQAGGDCFCKLHGREMKAWEKWVSAVRKSPWTCTNFCS